MERPRWSLVHHPALGYVVLPSGDRRERRTAERARELGDDLDAAAYVGRHAVAHDPLHPEAMRRELDRLQKQAKRRGLEWGRVLTRQGAVLFVYGPLPPRRHMKGAEVITEPTDRHTALVAALANIDPERRRAVELSRSWARIESRRLRARAIGDGRIEFVCHSKSPRVIREMLDARRVPHCRVGDGEVIAFRLPKSWGNLRRSLFLMKCEPGVIDRKTA